MSTHFKEKDDYVYPRQINWAQVLKDISEAGLTYFGTCRLLGVGWSTLQRWKNGEIEPRHSIGSSILLIHARYCGPELTKQRVMEAET